VTSREVPHLSLYNNRKTPAIGQYNPKFELLLHNPPAYKIREEREDIASPKNAAPTEEGHNHLSKIKCSKLTKKLSSMFK